MIEHEALSVGPGYNCGAAGMTNARRSRRLQSSSLVRCRRWMDECAG